MKHPKRPQEPHAPSKPIPPSKLLPTNTCLGSIAVDKYGDYTLESFGTHIIGNLDVNPKDIRFVFEVEQTPTYYDEILIDLSVSRYTVNEIENPNYDTAYNHYTSKLEKYNKEVIKFKEAKKNYKKDLAAYNKSMDIYNLEQSKLQVERLEKKLKK